jgi:hypothetical protein
VLTRNTESIKSFCLRKKSRNVIKIAKWNIQLKKHKKLTRRDGNKKNVKQNQNKQEYIKQNYFQVRVAAETE